MLGEVNQAAVNSHRSRWLRVKSDMPCPVCGKPDWCLVSADGKAAICARIAEGGRQVGEAGYLHRLDGGTRGDYSAPPIGRPTAKLLLVSPAKLNEVYSVLLEELALSEEHRASLRKRGLSEEAIEFIGCRSLPAERSEVIRRVRSRVEVKGVPGFYLGSQGVELGGYPGILLPVRNLDQLVVGCQIRRDDPGNGGKYVWLSSADRCDGSSPGAPAHFALPLELSSAEWLVITEGSLKAAVIAHFTRAAAVGVPGVTSWRRAVDIAIKLLPRHVVLAIDNDRFSNEAVKRAAKELETVLLFHHFNVYEAVWPAEFKGLDDYFAGGGHGLEFRVVHKASLIKRPASKPYYKESVANSANYARASVKVAYTRPTRQQQQNNIKRLLAGATESQKVLYQDWLAQIEATIKSEVAA